MDKKYDVIQFISNNFILKKLRLVNFAEIIKIITISI